MATTPQKRSLLGVDYESDSDEEEDGERPTTPVILEEKDVSKSRKKLRFAAPEMLTTIIEYDPMLPPTQEQPDINNNNHSSSFSFSFLPPQSNRSIDIPQYDAVPAPPAPLKPFSFSKTETVTKTSTIIGNVKNKVEKIDNNGGMWSNLSQYSTNSPPPQVFSPFHQQHYLIFFFMFVQ